MTEIPEDVPKDLPADIWLMACEVAHDVFDANCDLMEHGSSPANPALMIANAILAERERCARIADTVLLWKGMPGDFEANQVAAAIRANVTFPVG